jgi:hypothetical protein
MMLKKYYVVAVKDGGVVSIDVQAYSRGDVVDTLRNNGYAVVEITE